jgi:hypothetical protein
MKATQFFKNNWRRERDLSGIRRTTRRMPGEPVTLLDAKSPFTYWRRERDLNPSAILRLLTFLGVYVNGIFQG